MKNNICKIALITALAIAQANQAFADTASSIEKKLLRLEREQETQEENLRGEERDLKKAQRELAQAENALHRLEAQGKPADAALASRRDTAKQIVEDLKAQVESDQEALERAEEKAAKLEEQKEKAERKKPEPPKDCVECNARNQAPNQQKSTWDNISNIVSAITPLGLGAMNTYGNIRAMKQQSSDYRYYGDSMIAQGLPFAPNNYGTSSSISGLGNTSMFGNTNMFGNNNMFGNTSMYGNTSMLGNTSMFGNMYSGLGYNNSAFSMGLYGNMGMNNGFSMGNMFGNYGMMGNTMMGGFPGMNQGFSPGNTSAQPYYIGY